MHTPGSTRRLAIVVAIDVAGFSARTEADEARALYEVQTLRRQTHEIAHAHGGRVFNTAGDGFMLEFGSSLSAVEAAATLAGTCEPKVRVGVHLGDVVDQPDGDLLGHGVNVAARLMAMSEPGQALLSSAMRQTVRGPLADRLRSRGTVRLDKMQETLEVFALDAPPAADAPTAGAAAPETLIAVLPFDNLSTDTEIQFFSDGVSEDIIQRLSRGSSLRVIGRTSSFQFRGERKQDAAWALRCSHVLDGTVRRSGARARISAHLVDVATRTTLWSERYDRGLEDTFAVQDEIAEAIAACLQHVLMPARHGNVDARAHDLYLRASPTVFSPGELRGSVALLEEATQLAPSYADAWGRLAWCRAFLRTSEPFVERAESAARVAAESARALALDPQQLEALLGMMLATPPYGSFNALDATVERLRALPLNTGARFWTPFFSRPLGRMLESLDDALTAHALDCLNPMAENSLALAKMAAGRFDGVVDGLEALLARAPGMHFAVANLARAQAFLGNWDAVDRLLDPLANRPLRELEDGALFLRAKQNPSDANVGPMRERVLSRYERTGCAEISQLVYAAHLGLQEDVFRIADTARLGPRGASDDVMGVDGYRTGMLFWRIMPEIRQDRRFVKLCARLGLVSFWLRSGKWPDCVDEVPYDFRAECDALRDTPVEEFGF